MEHESQTPPVSLLSNPQHLKTSLLDPSSDLFDPDRIKAIVDQKLEQAMFEKV